MKMKARKARLEARQKEHDSFLGRISGNKRAKGYNKPGSLNK